MKNPYYEMRDEIIKMQAYFASLDDKSKKHPQVVEARLHLFRSRMALEALWCATSKK